MAKIHQVISYCSVEKQDMNGFVLLADSFIIYLFIVLINIETLLEMGLKDKNK